MTIQCLTCVTLCSNIFALQMVHARSMPFMSGSDMKVIPEYPIFIPIYFTKKGPKKHLFGDVESLQLIKSKIIC